MGMRWLFKACPTCGGDLYIGTDGRPGYKGKMLGKCLQCSRVTPVHIRKVVKQKVKA